MSMTKHERPGVYSSYDASSVSAAGVGTKTVGVAAKAVKGTVGQPVTLTGYTEGVNVFGEETDGAGMSALVRLLFANGASKVQAGAGAGAGAS